MELNVQATIVLTEKIGLVYIGKVRGISVTEGLGSKELAYLYRAEGNPVY
jgi:hypothetical protein